MMRTILKTASWFILQNTAALKNTTRILLRNIYLENEDHPENSAAGRDGEKNAIAKPVRNSQENSYNCWDRVQNCNQLHQNLKKKICIYIAL